MVAADRQVQAKHRARAHFAVDVDGPFMLSHDAVDHGQPQSAPFAHFLGGEEGLEDARQDVAGIPEPVSETLKTTYVPAAQLELGGPEGSVTTMRSVFSTRVPPEWPSVGAPWRRGH